jgi:hypothetical protein
LDKNSLTPIVSVVGSTTLNSGAEIAGISIIGISSNTLFVVEVTSPVSLSVIYNSNNINKPTTISTLEFDVTFSVIPTPLLNGVGTSQTTLILNTVIVLYAPSLGAALISVNSFGSLQFSNLSVIKSPSTPTTALNNMDVSSTLCYANPSGPALLIKDSLGMISSSVFQNIDSGV